MHVWGIEWVQSVCMHVWGIDTVEWVQSVCMHVWGIDTVEWVQSVCMHVWGIDTEGVAMQGFSLHTIGVYSHLQMQGFILVSRIIMSIS